MLLVKTDYNYQLRSEPGSPVIKEFNTEDEALEFASELGAIEIRCIEEPINKNLFY